ncbi:hypothetical protein lerEdw1_016496 [Lerista edwardsae]|nr:hypothetical protein lerEdw1_016496 [Lerista edwardsae]
MLAKDISIWLNQAVKGARDRHGDSIHNAHLLTLFHRLCKLLFFRIRPVFVFDGEAPLLKRQTLAKRRQRKEIAATDSKKTTEKLLKTFLKRQAIKTALAGKRQEEDFLVCLNVEFPSLSEVRREEVDDIYVLPSLEDKEKNSSEEEDEKEWEERMTQKQILQEELVENPHSVDVDSEDFLSLPPEVKHEILTDMKEFTKRRRTLFEAMPEESNDFSQYQLKGLLKKSSLNRHIENVQKEMNQQHSGQIQSQYENDGGFLKEVETRRVVSEDTSHYILIKGIQSKGGASTDRATTSAGHSSTVPKDSEPSANVIKSEPPPPGLSKSGSNSSAFPPAPPSPRTLRAIQAAMLGSSSEEELEDESKNHLDLDQTATGPGADAGHMSPRTLRAIQQALSEEEEEDVRAPFGRSAGRQQAGSSHVKELHTSSSDEEDQVAEVESGKECSVLPRGQTGTGMIIQESDLDQRKPILEKDQGTPKTTDTLFAEKRPLSEMDWEGVETQASRMDLSLVRDDNGLQPPARSPAQSVVPTCSNFPELTKNEKVKPFRELTCPSEKSASDEVPSALSFTPEAVRLSKEQIDEQSQSEESDSDGSFIEVEGKRQDEISEMPLPSTEPESGTVGLKERSEGVMENLLENSSEDVVENLLESSSGDAELAIQQNAETEGNEENTVNEWQEISMEELEDLETSLSVEQNTLRAQKQQQERVAATVTGQMFLESQASELLRLFGIPYIEAPMEAEAQCAVLDLTDQTSGTITDDSDIWLFGARHVYKNFFSQDKYVEYYQYVDFQNQLGLDRSKLINLAYLLGSDYTEGIPNVGYVTAMEILNEFPGRGMEPLLKLMEWWAEAQKTKKMRPNPHDTKVKKKLRQMQLTPGFPNAAVAEAYLHPVVDESKGSFVWGRPDLEQIREYPLFPLPLTACTFCQNRFGWTKSKTDEVLLPVLKQLNAQQSQLRIDSFFRLAQREKQAIRSQRVRRAVTCMRRKEKEEEDSEVLEATAVMEGELKQRKGEGPGLEEGLARTQSRNGKRKKNPPPQGSSCGRGGFIGVVHLSEASSGSSAEESENEDLTRRKRGKSTEALKADEAVTAQEPSSSSAEEETPLVTARPVFEGKKSRGRSVRGRRKK